jgi:thioredoxin 1
MNSKIIGIILLVLAVTGGFMFLTFDATVEEDNLSTQKERAVTATETDFDKTIDVVSASYEPFSRAAYERAISENKIILLYFYASWCPVCRDEQPLVQKAFNSFNGEKVIGFRVNYKDSDTDADELDLAEEFGVTYQHTKVILSDGKVLEKSLAVWIENDYAAKLGGYS